MLRASPQTTIGMATGLLAAAALLAGCGGGLSSGPPPAQRTTTVIVETLQAGTTDLLPVAADIVVGGVHGTTDLAQGYAIIANVPLGEADPPQQPLTVYAPGWITVSQMVTLNPYSYTTVSVALSPADPTRTGTVQGRVTTQGSGQGIANALVAFTPAAGEAVSGFTDAQGYYKFGGVPAGQVTVTAQATGYLEATRVLAVVADAAGSNPAVDLALLSGTTRVSVTGVVVQVGIETPVPGAQVTIGDRPPVLTDAAGRFTVAQVLVGLQDVIVTAPGYDEKREQVTVTPGMSPLRLFLAPSAPEPPGKPYTITGVVTLLGRPDNSGATVTALHRDLGEIMDTDTTTPAGNYYLFVPPGPYRITVRYGDKSIGRDVVLLGGGRILTGVDFTLSVSAASIARRVGTHEMFAP